MCWCKIRRVVLISDTHKYTHQCAGWFRQDTAINRRNEKLIHLGGIKINSNSSFFVLDWVSCMALLYGYWIWVDGFEIHQQLSFMCADWILQWLGKKKISDLVNWRVVRNGIGCIQWLVLSETNEFRIAWFYSLQIVQYCTRQLCEFRCFLISYEDSYLRA